MVVAVLLVSSCGLIDPQIGVTTAPVTSAVPVAVGAFEGHVTYSYIPPHPVGLIYLFHGSGGSAGFARQIETVDVLNTLTARGYGYVSTDSTERTGAIQWDVTHALNANNPDLQRLERLQQQLVATTGIEASTPLFAIGMSNGSAFASVWAEAFSRDGYPVRAVAKYMDGVPASVTAHGGVTVATQMVVGVNDIVTSPTKERLDLAVIQASGVDGRLDAVAERKLLAARFLRIPGVTMATADAAVTAIRGAGLIDANGTRILPVATVQARIDNVVLPASLTPSQDRDIAKETLAAFGMHQFNAEFKVQTADWFDAHRAA